MVNSIIIGIHGLSNKPKADTLEEWWKRSILEGLEKNHNVKSFDVNFKSVYWADVMYPEPDKNPDYYRPAKKGSIKSYKGGFKKEAFSLDINTIGSLKKYLGVDSLTDKVIEEKLKGLHIYYTDFIKKSILHDRLKSEILKNRDKRLMIIAHSMGSIIAYDVLREIEREFSKLSIEHFITIGSPLGQPYILNKIEEKYLTLRTPTIVKRWTNFLDKRDPVSLDIYLNDNFEENILGVKVKDDFVYNDWGGINHKSYGYLRTPEVSEAIIKFI